MRLKDAAKLSHVVVKTVRRWCLQGLKMCQDGPTLRLESYRIGSERFTTREAYDRFVLRRNGESGG